MLTQRAVCFSSSSSSVIIYFEYCRDFNRYVKTFPGWTARRIVATPEEKKKFHIYKKSKVYFVKISLIHHHVVNANTNAISSTSIAISAASATKMAKTKKLKLA